MKPLDRVLLKQPQIQELQEEQEQITQTLSPSNPFRNKISKPNLLHARSRAIDKTLEDFAPEPLSGLEQDKLSDLEGELRGIFTQGMPTEEEMRKNPAGMVDRHRKWEKANKGVIARWKNVRRQLEPDSEDPDLANIERFRPDGVMDRLVSNAQISGAMNYRNIPQEKWDTAFEGKGPENTALEQTKRRTLSEEQKQAARDRMTACREKKLADIHAKKKQERAESQQKETVTVGAETEE